MFPLTTLRELYRHMEWADALVWKSILACPQAEGDDALRDRVCHLHLVQRTFLHLWRGEPIEYRQPGDFESLAAMAAWAREYHRQVTAHMEAVDAAVLEQTLALPWAERIAARLGSPPRPVSVGDSMYQVVAHSTYHRGQVNTRLRELGGMPPMVDYIAWAWLGKPEAGWLESV